MIHRRVAIQQCIIHRCADFLLNISAKKFGKSHVSTLYWNIVLPLAQLPIYSIPTRSAACIWRNILVFHFAGLSIYSTKIYVWILTREKNLENIQKLTCLAGNVALKVGQSEEPAKS